MSALVALLGGVRATVWAALLLCALAFAGVQSVRLTVTDARLTAAEGRASADLLAAAHARLDRADAVLAAEHERAGSVARIADAYERGKTDAKRQGDAVAAGLRADTLRLNRLWQGCKARPPAALPDAAADPAEPDAADRLRFESAGRIVGTVAACQAERDALLELAEDDRKLVIPAK